MVFEGLVRLLVSMQGEKMNEVAVKENGISFSPSLPVTPEMLTQLKEQRRLLAEFVSSQLKRDSDYGVIPGTKKASLFKPGAEKIRGLFGLNVPIECTSSQLDRDQNFAMFTYKAKVLRGENLITECEASCNSQEQKYKERRVWRQRANGPGKEEIREVTPIFDVLNTLQKMAQKRAFVGAIILAVGASDFFTQDIDDMDDARSIGTQPQVMNSNQVPNVVSVTSAPAQNNQTKQWVKALVSFNDKQLAKDAGFRYQADSKMWVKEVTRAEVLAGFEFEVEPLI